MSFNPVEISTVIAFGAFLEIKDQHRRCVHRNADQKEPDRPQKTQAELALRKGTAQRLYHSQRAGEILYHTCKQPELAPYYPIISCFCTGLEYVLLDTPTLGTEVMQHVLQINDTPNTVTAVALFRKQIDYLHSHARHNDAHHRHLDAFIPAGALPGIREKKHAAAHVFSRLSSQITDDERMQMYELAAEIDGIKQANERLVLPSIPPAPTVLPFLL